MFYLWIIEMWLVVRSSCILVESIESNEFKHSISSGQRLEYSKYLFQVRHQPQ